MSGKPVEDLLKSISKRMFELTILINIKICNEYSFKNLLKFCNAVHAVGRDLNALTPGNQQNTDNLRAIVNDPRISSFINSPEMLHVTNCFKRGVNDLEEKMQEEKSRKK